MKRERPATSLIDNITTITGLSLGEVVPRGRDREGWRAVVASIEGATIITSIHFFKKMDINLIKLIKTCSYLKSVHIIRDFNISIIFSFRISKIGMAYSKK